MENFEDIMTSDEARKKAEFYTAMALKLEKEENVNKLLESDLFKRTSALIDSYDEIYDSIKKTENEKMEDSFRASFDRFLKEVPKLKKVLKLLVKASNLKNANFKGNISYHLNNLELSSIYTANMEVKYNNLEETFFFEVDIAKENNFLSYKGYRGLFYISSYEVKWCLTTNYPKPILKLWVDILPSLVEDIIKYFLGEILKLNPKEKAENDFSKI